MNPEPGHTASPIQNGPALLELSDDECRKLLSTRQMGRLGVNDGHYPLIFPVNYGLDGDTVVIRTHPGTKLTHASHANVSFQVDDLDEATHTGWSVLMLALAEEVTEAHRSELIASTRANGVQPWAPGEYGCWLRLIPHRLTGRRIVADSLSAE